MGTIVVADGVAVIALVGDQRGALAHGIEQGFGFLAIVDLAASQAQCNGTTFSVNEGMDLAREAASKTGGASTPATTAAPTPSSQPSASQQPSSSGSVNESRA